MTPRSDFPFDDLSAAIRAFQVHDPILGSREAMKALHFQESVGSGAMREAMKALQLPGPVLDMREALKGLQLQDSFGGQAMREAMKALQFQGPLGDVREVMRGVQLQDSFGGGDMREALKALQFQNPLRDIREAMKALQFQDSIRDVREAMRGLQIQESFRGREMREAMKGLHLHDPLRDARDAMKGLQIQNSFGDMREAIKQMRGPLPFEGIQGLTRAIAFGVQSQHMSPAFGGATLDLQGDETRWDEVGPDELRAVVDALAKLADSAPGELASAVDTLVREIRSLKDTRAQRLLYTVVIPLLIGFIGAAVAPIADHYVGGALRGNEKQLVQATELLIGRSGAEQVDLASVRIICAPDTKIRTQPRTRSAVIAIAQPGQVVALIERQKRWSLIGFFDERRCIQGYGWVRSKHLRAIRN